MKKFKRLLSLLLVCCLVAGMVPLSAAAAESPTSGSCGPNATWSYDVDTHTLTISGTGKIDDYEYGIYSKKEAPWEWFLLSGSQYIKTVIIGEGITRIGKDCFHDGGDCISKVQLPSTLTEIGESAFYGCESLTSIVLPDNLIKIEKQAFSWCTELRSVKFGTKLEVIGENAFSCTSIQNIMLPNSLKVISGYAFYSTSITSLTLPKSLQIIGDEDFGCNDGLRTVEIPASVTNIGKNPFKGSNRLSEIIVANENSIYCSVDGVLFTKNKTELITYPPLREGKEYTVPSTVLRIGDGAFNFSRNGGDLDHTDPSENLSSVKFPDKLQEIGSYAFLGCDLITSLDIPDAVREIGEGAFSFCASLRSIHLPPSITSIDGMFDHCSKIEFVEIPYGVEKITAFTFGYCNNLKDIIIPNSVKSFDLYAFQGSYNIKNIYFGGTKSEWDLLMKPGNSGLTSNATIHYNSTGPKNEIAVFSTEKSLTVKTGESMWLGFGQIANGQFVGDWKRMAVVVSDPTVVSLSEYEETEYGYSLQVTGKKQGATNVTITDTESGLSSIITISVRDSFAGTYSYAIDNMETFYPNNRWERNLQTNIYNLNGLYINNYTCSKNDSTYQVSFDAYNSKYHTAAVDIYDADGNWIDCEEIAKYQMISSLWDTGEQAYYLISDAVNKKLLTYEQASFSKHSHVSFEVPDGGYFTISNNFAESPGAFLLNACDILYTAVCTLGDAADAGLDKVEPSAFSGLIKKEITKDKTVREKFIEIFQDTAESEIRSFVKKVADGELSDAYFSDAYSDISGLLENVLNSLDISWKHLFETATGMGESAFIKFTGPVGVALKSCFSFSKGGNQLVQATHLAASVDAPYATVYSSIDEGYINPHGVIVNTNGNVDVDAELHVFRISNSNAFETELGGSEADSSKKCELYNICFVKNDRLVQPSGKVAVRIPIPNGIKENTCSIYRQESNGTWTLLDAHIEGNYLVFETDHFSLYSIVGELKNISISFLPNKTLYNVGEILESEGLELSLDGNLIVEGFVCEPSVLSNLGTQKVTVRYGDATAEFDVTVQKNPADITGITPSTTLTYNGSRHQGYTGTPSSAYTGEYEFLYTGRNSTTYNSATAPTNVGDYAVTIKIPDSDTTYTGSVSLNFSIAKADQIAPSAPELDSKTSNSITLQAIVSNANGAIAEYSKDNGLNWQSSPAFTGLTANTEYSFVARYAETENYKASPASSALKVTTDAVPAPEKAEQAAPSTPELESKTSNSITLKAIAPNANGAAAEYSKDNGSTWQASPTFTDLTANTEYSFVAHYTETENYKASPISASLKVTTDGASAGGGGSGGSSSGGGGSGGSGSPAPTMPTITVGEGGTAELSSDGTTLTITPDEGYEVKNVLKNGVSQGTVSQLTGLLPEDVIQITFEKIQQLPYTDVPKDAWFYESVKYVTENGLMSGFGNKKFGPNDKLTRAQIAQILYNKEGRPSVSSDSGFVDVAKDMWYAKAISWAAQNDIVTGYGGKRFGPNDLITREQLATILWRYDGSPEVSGNLDRFIDGNKTSTWAVSAMQWAVAEGIMNGNGNGTITPTGKATRAEVATMMKNYCEKK